MAYHSQQKSPPNDVWNALRVDGMVPVGKKLPKHFTVYDRSRVFGKGTRGDPKISWVYEIDTLDPQMVTRCTEIAKREAIRLQYSHAWIRGKNHGFKSTRSFTGEKVFVPSQHHVTVLFGPNNFRVHWEGHIWTKAFTDGSNIPQRRLEPSEVDEDGGNPQLYASGPYPYRNLPRDYPYPFKLDPKDNYVVYKLPPPHYYSDPQPER